MKNLTLTSNYNFVSGYGELLSTILTELPLCGYNVIPRSYSPICDKYVKFFDNPFVYDSQMVDLCLLNMNNLIGNENVLTHLKFDRPRILLTMWECTKINDLIVEILNKFVHIIVPNNYIKSNLINQGLSTKIDVVPLFCDTDFFVYNEHIVKDKFVFGISNEDPRKNLNRVVRCFLKTFKNVENVELQIKTCTPLGSKISDSKLKYLNQYYTKSELRDWYYNLDVYVSGATCEGWGMMQQESLCCGRPIIYTNYGGLSEFVSNESSFEIGYDEVYSTGCWGGYGGKWSEFKENDMSETMLSCYNNIDVVKIKGKLASVSVQKFSKNNFIKNLNKVLNYYI